MGRFLSLHTRLTALSGMVVAALAVGCSNQLSEEDRERLDTPRVQVYFNETGTRQGNQYDLKPSEFLVRQIDDADASIDVAAYGFDKPNIVHALLRAYDRGVDVRMVGDSTHLDEYGYERFLDRHIPMQVGNEYAIMHDKFFVIDDRFVVTGTGNITPTGYQRNDNHWVMLESRPVALDFKTHFEEMFEGSFSQAIEEPDDEDVTDAADPRRNTYQVGDTKVEVYFGPQEPALTRLREEILDATRSIHFQIFAFTKNEIGSAIIRKHREFVAKNNDDEEMPDNWREELRPKDWTHKVQGLLDRSQVHGNGQYHEVYRMEAFGVPLRIDANEASRLPGDYQAGGGRLHTKTMILDAGTEDARVVTGSFNWSSAASEANDESMVILHGKRIAGEFKEAYDALRAKSRNVPDGMCSYLLEARKHPDAITCSSEVEPGDVVFSEIHWDGWNGQTDRTGANITDDEFVELYNTTDEPIDLSLWSITNGHDFIMGFPPGTTIRPGEYFLVVDHVLEPYSELDPQRDRHAFKNPDFVLNTANDPRFPRLSLKNTSLHLELRRAGTDPEDEAIDVAGDHGPAFYGGRHIEEGERGPMGEIKYSIDKNYSMEREIGGENWRDGTEEAAWDRCRREKGGENVRESYRSDIVATPGAPNSE